jgi:hypothetical protein
MGVQFEENNGRRDFGSEPTPKIAAWLIKHGFAKGVSDANIIQIVIAVVFFALAIFFAVR